MYLPGTGGAMRYDMQDASPLHHPVHAMAVPTAGRAASHHASHRGADPEAVLAVLCITFVVVLRCGTRKPELS